MSLRGLRERNEDLQRTTSQMENFFHKEIIHKLQNKRAGGKINRIKSHEPNLLSSNSSKLNLKFKILLISVWVNT